jgi:hypothetical protein
MTTILLMLFFPLDQRPRRDTELLDEGFCLLVLMTVEFGNFRNERGAIGPPNPLGSEGGSAGMTEISLSVISALSVFYRVGAITFFTNHQDSFLR